MNLSTLFILFFSLLAGALALEALHRRNALRATGCLRIVFFLAGIIFVGVLIGSLWITHDRALAMVHPQHIAPHSFPASVGLTSYQEVSFPSFDRLILRGWYFATQNGATVILLHGHGGNRGGMLHEAAILRQEGYGILMYDARNCGMSDGNFSTFGLLEKNDVAAALSFLQAQPGIDMQRIGILGHSMGGATASLAAAEMPELRAVVIESAFASLEETVRHDLYTFVGLPPFPFAPLVIFWGERETGVHIGQVNPIEKIAAISPRPVLIIHGALDSTLPVENAYQLYEAAYQPKSLYILPQGKHCCLAQTGETEYARQLIEFFGKGLGNK